jgi:hypothetical protein
MRNVDFKATNSWLIMTLSCRSKSYYTSSKSYLPTTPSFEELSSHCGHNLAGTLRRKKLRTFRRSKKLCREVNLRIYATAFNVPRCSFLLAAIRLRLINPLSRLLWDLWRRHLTNWATCSAAFRRNELEKNFGTCRVLSRVG